MERLLERLERRLRWTLIQPQSEPGTCAGTLPPACPNLLQRVVQMRADMGLVPDQPEPRHAFSNAGVWHLIATDAAGEIAGTVRLYVIDRQRERLAPADIPHIGHVLFPSVAVREQHLLVLRRLFADKVAERYFIAPGGMFTTPVWRGSGLAAALGAAAIAMARLHRSRFSASFTAVRGQTQGLFTTFGGRPPVLPDGQPIAPFTCMRHGFPLQLLVFDAQEPGPRVEAGVGLMVARLRTLLSHLEQAA